MDEQIEWMDRQMDERMDGQMNERMDGQIDGLKNGWMNRQNGWIDE